MPKISVQDAALLYKVSERTIYRWIEAKGIKSYSELYDLDALQNAFDELPHRKKS
jgi:predicted DNA-binding transcriptional regulator YafY